MQYRTLTRTSPKTVATEGYKAWDGESISVLRATLAPAFRDSPDNPQTPDPGTAKNPIQNRLGGKVRLFSTFVAAACTTLLLGATSLAAPPVEARAITHNLDIPAQDLGAALKALGAAANEQVLFSNDVVAGLHSTQLKGEYSTDEAVTLLLKGSGLNADRTPSGVLLIRSPESSSPKGPSSSLLHGGEKVPQADEGTPLSLQGREGTPSTREEKKGFWQRFRLAQADTASRSDEENKEPSSRENDKKVIELEEIVVTGTHIRGVPPVGSQLNVYSREDIERQGSSRMEDFLARVPQNHSSVSSLAAGRGPGALVSNDGTMGSSEPNLRGLGAGSTLSLLNGTRLTSSGIITTGVDVSFIPISALDRVEILSDGASSIYGADAVGGVVNFMLRRDFSGFETSGRYEDTTRGGGSRWFATQLAGTSWGSGNGLLAYQHDKQEPLFARQRDFVTPGPLRPSQLLTSSGQDSVIGHLAQDLGAMQLEAVGYYGDREASSDLSSVFRQLLSAQIKQYGGSLALNKSFGTWNARLEGNSSRNSSDARTDFPDFDVTSRTRTSQSSKEAALRLDGPLFAMAEGMAKASIGASYRRETDLFENIASGNRYVKSGYAELLIPIVGRDATLRFARELSLSLSGRFDDYSDVGSATSPHAGFNWNVSEGVNLRGSWSRAFRAPYLQQLNGPLTYVVYRIADPNADDGFTNTIVDSSQAVPNLKPERSTNISLGVDLFLPSRPELRASLNYFRIRYKDRIQRPPLLGIDVSVDLYQPFNTALAAPFLDSSPDPARVAGIFAITPPNFILDTTGEGEAGVEAIYDARVANLALDETDGLDLSLSYAMPAAGGDLSASIGGSYIFDLQRRALAATPTVDFVDTVYNPVGLRTFLTTAWRRGPLSLGLNVNYIDSYRNPVSVPPRNISSWTTTDLSVSLDLGRQRHDRSPFTLSAFVRNLTDKSPPPIGNFGIAYSVGYDETNANPLGRVIAVQLATRW